MMSETPNDIVRRLRQTHPRSWFIAQTGGVLTHAKVSNIEKGRQPSVAEAAAIMALPGAVITALQAPEYTPQDEAAIDAGFHPHMQVMTPEEAVAVVDSTAPVPDVSLLDLHRRFTEAITPPVPTLPPPGVVTIDEPPRAMTGGMNPGINIISGSEDTLILDPEVRVTPSILSLADGFMRFGNSEFQTFKDCPRRWWLAYYRKLALKTESPLGVRATGDRCHRALERWYVPDVSQRIDPRDALERAITEDWMTLVDEHNGDVPIEIRESFNKSTDLERAMIEGYVQWLAETGADADYTVIAPEAYVEAKLSIPNVLIIGRLDVRVRRNLDGVRLFMDHKTVGDLTTPTRTLGLDEQMLHYMLLEHLATDPGEARVAGAIYNMLRRVKRTAAAKPPFYGRVEVHHNAMTLGNFRARLEGTLHNLLATKDALDAGADHHAVAYPRPTRDCAWKCAFFQICGMFDDGSRVEDAIARNYEQTDPYSYYEIEPNAVAAS